MPSRCSCGAVTVRTSPRCGNCDASPGKGRRRLRDPGLPGLPGLEPELELAEGGRRGERCRHLARRRAARPSPARPLGPLQPLQPAGKRWAGPRRLQETRVGAGSGMGWSLQPGIAKPAPSVASDPGSSRPSPGWREGGAGRAMPIRAGPWGRRRGQCPGGCGACRCCGVCGRRGRRWKELRRLTLGCSRGKGSPGEVSSPGGRTDIIQEADV